MSDPIDQVWASAANQDVPPPARAAAMALAARFASRDRARRRRLFMTGAVLGLFSLGVAAAMVESAGSIGGLGPLALLAASWAAWAVLWRQGGAGAAALAGTAPLVEAWAAMQRRNRAERRGALLLAAVIGVSLGPLWWSVGQLLAEGKASEREALQMGLLLSAALLAGVGFILGRYFLSLKPEARRLEMLAAERGEL